MSYEKVTIYDFLCMSEPEQYATAWDGQLLTDRRKGAITFQLYSVNDFFIEVAHNAWIAASSAVKPLNTA